MSTNKSINTFLSQYNNNKLSIGTKARPAEGDPPPTDVQDWFAQAMGSGDHHVIPLNKFEFRVHGEDQTLKKDSNIVRYGNIIGTVENAWDALIGQYGLEAVSTYVPFHYDLGNYGIYIRQQGIRFLGHLLFQWSRVQGMTDRAQEYGDLLKQYDFQSSNRLHFENTAFESVEEAFTLAREIILRYQWFRHQIELLAAYLEDATGSTYYSSYSTQLPASVEQAEAILSKAYVARSYSCQSKVPVSGLYRSLFKRMISNFPASDQVDKAAYGTKFDQLCNEVVADITGQSLPTVSGQHPRGGILAERLPFETDVWGAVPSQLPVYVTRNEFSTDNGSYGPKEVPLDPDWEINTSETWDDAYECADGSLQQRADNAVNKLEANVRHDGFEWKPCKPDNRWYFRLDQQIRGVADIDNGDFTIELVDFGNHSLPDDYGCWN